jgi:hypothetical protein
MSEKIKKVAEDYEEKLRAEEPSPSVAEKNKEQELWDYILINQDFFMSMGRIINIAQNLTDQATRKLEWDLENSDLSEEKRKKKEEKLVALESQFTELTSRENQFLHMQNIFQKLFKT